MNKTAPIILIMLVTLVLSGCGAATSEAGAEPRTQAAPGATARPEREVAADTLSAMLELAEAGDWGAYVDEYYGETHKFRSADDRNALVSRFEQKWGPKILDALRRASTVTPTIGADGRASFLENGELLFMLYKGDDGRWTFHL